MEPCTSSALENEPVDKLGIHATGVECSQVCEFEDSVVVKVPRPARESVYEIHACPDDQFNVCRSPTGEYVFQAQRGNMLVLGDPRSAGFPSAYGSFGKLCTTGSEAMISGLCTLSLLCVCQRKWDRGTEVPQGRGRLQSTLVARTNSRAGEGIAVITAEFCHQP